jgi:hypothetical protein
LLLKTFSVVAPITLVGLNAAPRWLLRLVLLTAACGPAAAGPPFRTDDPEPVEPGHWEIYEFSAATHVTGDTAGILSGTDANYGAVPELQLHAAFPIAFDKPGGNGMVLGGSATPRSGSNTVF